MLTSLVSPTLMTPSLLYTSNPWVTTPPDHSLLVSTPSEAPLGSPPGPTEEDGVTLEPNYVVFSFSLLILFTIVLGNLAVIIILSSTPKLRNQTGLCMISLGIADFLIGVFYLCVSLPCSLHGDCLIMNDRLTCLGSVIISYTCYSSAFCTLVVLSFNRAFLISHPLRYKTLFTMTTMLTVLAGSWIASVGVVSGFILSRPHIIQFDPATYTCGLAAFQRDAWPYSYTINIAGFLIPVVIISGCSWKIASVTRNARRRVHQVVDSSRRSSVRRQTSFRGSRSDLKTTVRIFVVVVAFVVCYLPYQIQLVYARYTKEMFPSKASMFSCMLLWADSAVNPIIIAFTYSNFRKVLRAKLTKLCSFRRRSVAAMSGSQSGNDTENQHVTSRTTNTTSLKSTSHNKSSKRVTIIETSSQEESTGVKLEQDGVQSGCQVLVSSDVTPPSRT